MNPTTELTNPDEITAGVYRNVLASTEDRVYDLWHASALSSCLRSHFLRRKHIPVLRKPTGGVQLRMDAGHAFELAVRPQVHELFSDIESNLRLTSEDLQLTGEMDNYDRDTGTIIEIKTVHPMAIRYRKVSEDRFHLKEDKQYYHHELQQHAYVLLLRERGLPVNQIIYIYIALDGRIATYVTPVKEELVTEVQNRLASLNRFWERNELPPCTCTESDPLWGAVHQYCDYRPEYGQCCAPLITPKEG